MGTRPDMSLYIDANCLIIALVREINDGLVCQSLFFFCSNSQKPSPYVFPLFFKKDLKKTYGKVFLCPELSYLFNLTMSS